MSRVKKIAVIVLSSLAGLFVLAVIAGSSPVCSCVHYGAHLDP